MSEKEYVKAKGLEATVIEAYKWYDTIEPDTRFSFIDVQVKRPYACMLGQEYFYAVEFDLETMEVTFYFDEDGAEQATFPMQLQVKM